MTNHIVKLDVLGQSKSFLRAFRTVFQRKGDANVNENVCRKAWGSKWAKCMCTDNILTLIISAT